MRKGYQKAQYIPLGLWKRITKATKNVTEFINAACFHFLTLAEQEREMILRDYRAMKETK